MKLFIILLVQSIALFGHAETRTIENPDYMSLFADGVKITRVEFGKHSTSIFFHAEGKNGSFVRFLRSTFLVDENGIRYEAKSCKGMALGEWTKIGENGFLDFSISFETLPEDIRVFDCVEGAGSSRNARFYGIRAKGQDWNVFESIAIGDNPFPDSFFRIDTVYVSGRISKSKYERTKGTAVHLVQSFSQQQLIRTFRDNRGIFDFFFVDEDGTFSFKTLVAKPSLDALNLYGTEIPVLLIPGDHLFIEVENLGESGQKVAFRSAYTDYSRLILNIPFMHDEEMDNPVFTNDVTLSTQSWQPLHEKLDLRMEICRYISAKHGFTMTEQKLMQMVVQTNCALLSVSKMLMVINNQRQSEMIKMQNENSHLPLPQNYTEKQLEGMGISMDFSFLKDCAMDDPHIVATPSYEALMLRLVDLASHVQFKNSVDNGIDFSTEENILLMAQRLGMSGDMGKAIIANAVAEKIWSPVIINGRSNIEKDMQKLDVIKRQISQPYARTLAEANYMVFSQSDGRNSSIRFGENAEAVKRLLTQYGGKKLVLLPLHEYGLKELRKIEQCYRLNRREIDQEAVIVPFTTRRLLGKRKLREFQFHCPMLHNTVYLSEETFLHLRNALQFTIHQRNERIIFPDETYDTKGYSFFKKYN